MSAPLPASLEAVDRELSTLARFKLDPQRFPETAARDQARVDELLEWRLELQRETTGGA